MRKSVILLVLLSLLIFPTFARAQSAVTFEKLVIQVWPDFDQQSVLVIYDFVVSSETPLPSQVNIRMPVGAQLFAVARDEAGMLMNVEHDQPVQEGNYSVVTFVVADRLTYRLEFYIPYVRQEQRRTFIYTWPGDYAVASFRMMLQEPAGAANIATEPDMNEIIPGADGFTYRALSTQDVKAGAEWSLKVSYDSKNGEPFIEKPQPSAPLEPSQPFLSFLPWILGGVGVTLIVGGGIWYWLSGRSGSGAGRSRKRHVSREDEDAGAAAYCSQCGKRAQSSDRFCRACGTKLRQ
jgi:hypothetical protein